MYSLIFFKSKALAKDKKKLLKDKKSLGFIQEALGKLAVNPFDNFLPVKKLRSPEEGTFRMRCGVCRIIYDIDTKNQNIIIYRIKQRKEGY